MSRARKPSGPPQSDLFGGAPAARPKDQTPVEIPLQVCGQTDVGWLLRPAMKGAAAKWAPKALVHELTGERSGVFRMPRWIADERGWG